MSEDSYLGRDLRWLREAEAEADKEREAAQASTQQRPHQGSLFGDPAFSDLAAWHDEKDLCSGRIEPGTRDSRRSYIRQALAWLHQRSITHPEAADWLSYREWRLSQGCPNRVTKSTWNSHRKVLAGVYDFCRQVPKRGWGPIPNPLHYTQVPPDEERRKVPRSMAQPDVTYPLLLQAMPDIRWKAFISVLRWLGPRIQEALGIPLPGAPADAGRKLLDIDRGRLSIWQQRDTEGRELKDLKTGYSQRVLEIPPEPLELIRQALVWKRHQDANPTAEWKRRRGACEANFLFPFRREHLEAVMEIHRKVSPEDFPEWLRGERGAAAWHVYRHTMAIRYAEEALDLGEPNWDEDLHRILGHADKRTTDAYLTALRQKVVSSSGMSRVWAAQKERMDRAVEERSGKGLQLVKRPGENKR